MSLRICFVTDSVQPTGSWFQFQDLIACLQAQRFQVNLLVLSQKHQALDHLDASFIEFTNFVTRRWTVDPNAIYKLWQAIRRYSPDIVHCWSHSVHLSVRAATARNSNVKVINSYWRSKALQTKFDRFLARKTPSKRSLAVATSPALAAIYEKQGIASGQFHHISVGAQREISNPESPQEYDEIFKKQLGIPENAWIIASTSKLEFAKNIDDIIWAIDLVSCTRNDVHLVVAGDGLQLGRLRLFAHQAGVGDRVHFVGHLRCVDSLLCAADIFVNADSDPGHCRGLLQAVEKKIPIIASDNVVHRSLFGCESMALYFPVGDRAELARNICQTLQELESQPTSLAGQGNAANRRAQRAKDNLGSVLDFQKSVEAYCELYRNISV